jgi:hypothetical protein
MSRPAAAAAAAGYQVEVFRKLAAAVGWHTDDYVFSCTGSHAYMLEDLVDPSGHCSLSATGEEPHCLRCSV